MNKETVETYRTLQTLYKTSIIVYMFISDSWSI